jgi:GNAT superfamily N-acetyltransferase
MYSHRRLANDSDDFIPVRGTTLFVFQQHSNNSNWIDEGDYMKQLTMRKYETDDDYWRLRVFLRDVFLLNNRRPTSWQVARLDYWRWFGVEIIESYAWEDNGIFLWETPSGQIAAALNPEGQGELYLQTHPAFYTPDLVCEMVEVAEKHLSVSHEKEGHKPRIWVHDYESVIQEVLARRGYRKGSWPADERQRSLALPLPEARPVEGFTIRSLGEIEELPARSWSSWRSFHPDAPEAEYIGWEWYHCIQQVPLYRRDLDIVAVAPGGEIAAFCTLWYDDVTRTGYFEPVGTAPEYQRRGLGKAVMIEAMRRAKRLGATLVTVDGFSEAANALYASTMTADYTLHEAWEKVS